jgi:Flp pilus assembly protein TadD
MAWVMYLRGNYEDAGKFMQRALESGEVADPVVFEHLGDIRLKLGREREALEAYRQALRLGPEDPGLIREKIRNILKNPPSPPGTGQ